MTTAASAMWFTVALATACTRPPATSAVEPVTVAADPDASPIGGEGDATSAGDVPVADTQEPDAGPTGKPGVGGGLWVVDAAGQPIGVLISRGHPALSATGVDILRDGVLVYSPQAGLFFGLQMSSGKVIAPKLGVTDTSCAEPIVAGYYTADSTVISGQGYAFVYDGSWYRIDAFKPVQQVTCGGTVSEGPDPKCSAHAGSCRGFPVSLVTPPLPTVFPAPLAFSWVAK